jgi:N-acetylglucosamine-6-sulfatase
VYGHLVSLRNGILAAPDVRRPFGRVCATLVALAAFALPAGAHARTTTASADGRPNVLVVMTDDMSRDDLKKLPNVKRLLADQGTTFTNAVDSFPLCCPARATFITGQYAHNHKVIANFYPYGWYGMKNRQNVLPVWLRKSGYRTALIGKWLNGYGAKDAHGEVPAGFDIWRGLLDASAYDYFNFVMNVDGLLKSWGDGDFARKLVEFAEIEVIPNPSGLAGVFAKLTEIFGPGPYKYWGTTKTADYSPDVTGKVTEDILRKEKSSKKPFFVWWAPAAAHREDIATTLMGRPGPDPRPAPRYAARSKMYKLPKGPNFNEADISDKPLSLRKAAAEPLTQGQLDQLQLDYEGRIGSLLAVDDHVKTMVDVLKATKQLDNTMIVFVSDNGWLQGEHRINGDKFLPYENSLQVPLIIRGPGVRKGVKVTNQVSNIDFAPTLVDVANAKPGRVMDGVSLLPMLTKAVKQTDSIVQIEAPAPLFDAEVPINAWDRPYKGVRTTRYTYAYYIEAGDEELYDRHKDPAQLHNVAADPAYAAIKARLVSRMNKLDSCAGKTCRVAP